MFGDFEDLETGEVFKGKDGEEADADDGENDESVAMEKEEEEGAGGLFISSNEASKVVSMLNMFGGQTRQMCILFTLI